MSALGHKRTYAMQQPMSALLSIATAKADSPNFLSPRKRTCAVQLGMSALSSPIHHKPLNANDTIEATRRNEPAGF